MNKAYMENQWKAALVLSGGLWLALLIYGFVYSHEMSATVIVKAIAGAGGFTIGISFGLGPAVRYFHVPQSFLKYRREIGITGYLFALIYAVLQVLMFPGLYFDAFPKQLLTTPSLLGIFAMTVLTIMTVLSNDYSVERLGYKPWKFVMRMGYVAYAALIFRAYLMEGDVWFDWLGMPHGLAPPRLVLSVFASFVVLCGLVQFIPSAHKAKRASVS